MPFFIGVLDRISLSTPVLSLDSSDEADWLMDLSSLNNLVLTLLPVLLRSLLGDSWLRCLSVLTDRLSIVRSSLVGSLMDLRCLRLVLRSFSGVLCWSICTALLFVCRMLEQ